MIRALKMLLVLVASHSSLAAAQEDSLAVIQRAKQQFLLESLAYGRQTEATLARGFVARRYAEFRGGAHLWAVAAEGIFDRPPYLIGVTHGQIVPLGFFDAPDLVAWCNAVCEPGVSDSSALTNARLLLWSLEPRSLEWYTYLADEVNAAPASPFVRAWRGSRGATWGADTVMRLPNSGIVVRQTVLARLSEIRPEIRVRTFVMQFDTAGRLVAWTQRPEERWAWSGGKPQTAHRNSPLAVSVQDP